MNITALSVAGLIVCALAAPGFAQSGGSAANPAAPEMDQLKPAIGSWVCSGDVFETSLAHRF
jgi:hypothetical protein